MKAIVLSSWCKADAGISNIAFTLMRIKAEYQSAEKHAIECNDFCSKNIPLNLKELQLEGMLFVVSQCNNNNVLEIVIPKIKQEGKKPQLVSENL
jgi:hypothetical protein